jgi:hypothetical protein
MQLANSQVTIPRKNASSDFDNSAQRRVLINSTKSAGFTAGPKARRHVAELLNQDASSLGWDYYRSEEVGSMTHQQLRQRQDGDEKIRK